MNPQSERKFYTENSQMYATISREKKKFTDVSDNIIHTNSQMQSTISHAQTDVERQLHIISPVKSTTSHEQTHR